MFHLILLIGYCRARFFAVGLPFKLKSMKYLLILSIVFFSCSKKSDTITQSEPADPYIKSCTFSPIFEAGENHPMFNVSLFSDSSKVDKVVLFISPSTLRWQVLKPSTGNYIMYDHVGKYPTYAASIYYYFVFYKKDGTVISTTPFQVY